MSGPKDIPPFSKTGTAADSTEAEFGDLSQAYRRLAREEPPAALDDAIRAAARRAVHARPQPMRKSWFQRWTGPVATAAVVVLTVSIGLMTVEEKPEFVPPPMQQAMKPRTAISTDLQEGKLKEETPSAVESARMETKTDGLAARRRDRAMEERPPEAPRALQKKAPPPMAASEPASPPFVPDAEVTRERSKRQAAPSPSPTESFADSAEPRMKSKANPLAENAGTSSPRDEAPVSLASPQAAESRVMMRSAESAASAAIEPPEAWLKRILALQKEGKEKEVEEELAKFKRSYPDYPLPMVLRSAPDGKGRGQ